MEASCGSSAQGLDDAQSRTVLQAHVEHREGRRLGADGRHRLAHALHHAGGEAARFQGPAESHAQRRVVVEQQEGPVGQASHRGFDVSHGQLQTPSGQSSAPRDVGHIMRRVERAVQVPGRRVGPDESLVALHRFHPRAAPAGGDDGAGAPGVAELDPGPVRSSRVLAMKKPRPMPIWPVREPSAVGRLVM